MQQAGLCIEKLCFPQNVTVIDSAVHGCQLRKLVCLKAKAPFKNRRDRSDVELTSGQVLSPVSNLNPLGLLLTKSWVSATQVGGNNFLKWLPDNTWKRLRLRRPILPLAFGLCFQVCNIMFFGSLIYIV